MTRKEVIRFLLPYYKKHLKGIVWGVAALFLLSLLVLPTPLITRRIIDYSLPHKDARDLLTWVLAALGLLVFSRTIAYFYMVLFFRINAKIMLDIRLKIVIKLSSVSLRVYNKYSTGYLISRINDDATRLGPLLANSLAMILRDILILLVGVIAILTIHWKLSLLTLAILPIFVYVTTHYREKVKELSKKYYECYAQETNQLEETLTNMRTSKMFHNYGYSRAKYYKAMLSSYYSNLKQGNLTILINVMAVLVTGIYPLVIMAYGGLEVISGRLSIGSIFAFNVFVGYLFGPVNRLINANVQIQQAAVSLRRIYEFFELPDEEIDTEFRLNDEFTGIKLSSIRYSFDGDKEVLVGIDLCIMKGERIGLAGNSGSGKTTLIRIISGLYVPESGCYELNGESLTKPQIATLRQYVAVVDQEPCLFRDTVFNNIRFGNPDADESQVISCAIKAHADEFINKLKDGYQTIIDNDSLSVGQKQRIAIARALLRNTKILILDEATSNIDAISESYINKTIMDLPPDMALIIVAHRLSTLQQCSRILVLEDGRITQNGSFDELAQKEGLFRKLIQSTKYKGR
ncbi:MAG: ABC transporter ATP-binding protein [Candidatus Cloacimonadaceae bacterium]|jgi:ABC-type bacteriocin/lantibiotic exporter with double-glycine peptidase domain